MTRGRFARRLLSRLSAPESRHNLVALMAWMQAEGGAAAWNPLNTTLRRPGSTPYNDVGVQNYPDPTTGIGAAAATLADPRYADVVAQLRYNAPPADTLRRVGASDWGTSRTLLAAVLPDVQADLGAYERREVAGG